MDRTLAGIGWRPEHSRELAALGAGLTGGRVTRVDRTAVTVFTPTGERRAAVAAALTGDGDPLTSPTVGDFVALRSSEVVAVLERHSLIVRGSSVDQSVPQPLAANVDRVFVTHSLGDRFRPRRLERLIVLAWQSGASPVVVLTKADLAVDLDGAVDGARALLGTDEVVVVSALARRGVGELARWLEPASTVVLLGSSGAGKSTLANLLLEGTQALATGEVRSDGRGRHTTTARELVWLPGGALLVDTPGLRSLALFAADASIGDAFADVGDLAEQCRFADCRHHGEPGCALAAAIEAGELDAARFDAYERLLREQQALEARTDYRLRNERRAQWKAITKANRQANKQHRGRRER